MSAVTHLDPNTTHLAGHPDATGPTRLAAGRHTDPPYGMGLALAAVTAPTTAVTLLRDGLLDGPAVMQGSVRGTAAVMLLLATPALLAAMVSTRRGGGKADSAILWWLGVTGYLMYNSVLLVFATPFNALYLAYETMLGLSIAGVVVLLRRLDVTALARRVNARSARPVAVFIAIVALANLAAWLRLIVPALTQADPAFLVGTGLITNPVHNQDLAFWIPVALLIATWLWQRRPIGLVLAIAYLIYWLLEAISVASDQWFGATADPASTVATMGGAYLFAGVAVVTAIPLIAMVRRPT